MCHVSHVGRPRSQFPNPGYLPRQESAMSQSLWISAGFNGSTSSCSGLRCANLVLRIWNFDHLAAAKLFKTATSALGTQRHDLCAKRATVESAIGRVRGFRNLQKVQKRGQWKAYSSVYKTRPEQSSGGRLPLSPRRPLRNKLEEHMQRAVVLLTKRVWRSNCLQNAWRVCWIWLRGKGNKLILVCVDMCSTQSFGSRHDVTQPLVLTWIRQDVSAGRRVAGKISLPRQHSLFSVSAAIANLLHRTRMPWILEHPYDWWFWDVPKIKLLRHTLVWPGPNADFSVFLDHDAESGLCFQLETWTAGICTVLHARVLGQVDVAVWLDKKHVDPKTFASRSKFSSSRDHACPSPFIFRVCHGFSPWTHVDSRETHPFRGMRRLFTQHVKGYWYGRYWLCAHLWIRTSDWRSVYCSGWLSSH